MAEEEEPVAEAEASEKAARAPCGVQCGASEAHDELRLVRPWICGRRSGACTVNPP